MWISFFLLQPFFTPYTVIHKIFIIHIIDINLQNFLFNFSLGHFLKFSTGADKKVVKHDFYFFLLDSDQSQLFQNFRCASCCKLLLPTSQKKKRKKIESSCFDQFWKIYSVLKWVWILSTLTVSRFILRLTRLFVANNKSSNAKMSRRHPMPCSTKLTGLP